MCCGAISEPVATQKLQSSQWAHGFEKSATADMVTGSSSPQGRFQHQEMPAKGFFDCYVSYIADPSKFWISMKSSETELESMMDNLNSEYNAMRSNQMLINRPVPSQVCCAKYSEDDTWYRAKVLITGDDQCVVYFVDYGNDESVPLNRLKQLSASYCALPVQAIECCLTDVEPDGNTWTKQSIECFEQLTVNKKLVGSMVRKQETGKYEIELIDNTIHLHDALIKAGLAKDVSVPLQLSGVGSRRGSGASSSSRGSGSLSGKPSNVRMAVTGDTKLTYKHQTLPVGRHVDVHISHVDNPHNFWCQLTEETSSLKHVMKRIGDTYGRLSLADLRLTNPEVGQPCCSIFSEDDTWYRGTIKEIKPGQPDMVQVTFVDYGNEEWVELDQVKQMKKSHTELAVQCVKCSLEGVSPSSAEWTVDDVTAFEDMTYDKNLVAKVLEKKSGVYVIDLYDASDKKTSVKDKIIASGIANRSGITVKQSELRSSLPIHQEKIEERTPPRKQERSPPRDRPSQPETMAVFKKRQMTIGQTYKMCVSWVNSPADFYCQVEDAADELNNLVQELYEYYISVKLKAFAVHDPREGQSVVAYYAEDGNWYRGIIQKATTTHAVIHYADYGNAEKIPLSKVKQVKPEFATLPVQAVRCCIYGLDKLPSDRINKKGMDAFSNAVATGLISCQILDQNDDLYLVDFQDQYGTSLADELSRMLGLRSDTKAKPVQHSEQAVVVKNVPAAIPSQVSLADFNIPQAEVEVYVTSIYSFSRFYIQLASSVEHLAEFASELDDQYQLGDEATMKLHEIKVGQICCARFSEDDSWYRAKVIDIANGTAKVTFIDYGNEDHSPVHDLRVLTPKFQSTPPFAVECSLKWHGHNTKSEDLEGFLKAVEDEKALKAIFRSSVAPFEVSLLDGIIDLSSQFTTGKTPDLPQETRTQDHVTRDTLPVVEIPSSPVSVYISLVDSPSHFYLHLVARSNDLDMMMAKIESVVEGAPVRSKPAVGDLCAALYAEDKAWYRAKVTNVDGAIISVSFFDYGNAEVVDISKESIWVVPDTLRKEAPFAIKCQLEDLPSNLTDEATGALVDLGMDKELTAVFIEKTGDCWTVRLMDGDINIGKEIGKLAPEESSTLPTTENSSPELPPSEVFSKLQVSSSCTYKAYIAHAESFQELYIQLNEKADELDALMGDLEMVESSTEVITTPVEGQVCAAMFVDENDIGAWYRGRVTEVSGTTVTVHFVDYGNSQTVDIASSPIKCLQSQFTSQPQFAIKCQLPDTLGYPPFAFDKLAEISLEKELDVTFLSSSEPYEVMLKVGDEDLLVEVNKCIGESNNDRSVTQDLPPAATAADSQPAEPVTDLQLTATASKNLEGEGSVEETAELEMKDSDAAIPTTMNSETEEPDVQKPSPIELAKYEEFLIAAGKFQVSVSSIESPDQFYLQFTKDQAAIEEMLDMLEEKYMSNKSNLPMDRHQLGEPCCGQDTDGVWYRAMITGVDHPLTTVTFVDYGNSTQVRPECMQGLLKQFLSPPPYAFEVCLEGSTRPENGWPIELIAKMNDILSDKILTAEILDTTTKPYRVKLFEKGANLNDSILMNKVHAPGETSVASSVVEEPCPSGGGPVEPVKLPVRSLQPGDVDVYVSSVVSMERFYVHLAEEEDQLDDLVEMLNQSYGAEDASQCKIRKPEPGMLCCAKWAEDGQWYRGEVRGTVDDGVEVIFVDYGNTENVVPSDVKELDSEFCTINPFTIECKLNIEDPSVEMSESFKEKAVDKLLKASVMSDCPPFVVDLYDGEKNLYDGSCIPSVSEEMVTPESHSETSANPDASAQVDDLESPSSQASFVTAESPEEVGEHSLGVDNVKSETEQQAEDTDNTDSAGIPYEAAAGDQVGNLSISELFSETFLQHICKIYIWKLLSSY